MQVQNSKFKIQNYGGFLSKTFLFFLFTFNFLLLTFPYPVSAATCDPKDPKFGPCPAGLNELENMVGNVISLVAGLGFIVMLVLLVMAGIKYLTSGGEPKAVQAAHLTLTWALLGVVFLAIAWLLLQLIAGFTGIDVTVFDIKKLCGDITKGFDFCKP